MTVLGRIGALADTAGLTVAGGLHEGGGTVVLLAPALPGMWERFSAGPEFADGDPDPLDRWSRRVIGAIAGEVGGRAVFPFGGPPYAPFLRWAAEGEGARPSPVGMLVSSVRGLWLSYRGAVEMPDRIALPDPASADPCLGCPAPCLTACPVGALGRDGYDVPACTGHVTSPEGRACREEGCRVRHACPAGADAVPPGAQNRFHMAAFLAAHGGLDRGVASV